MAASRQPRDAETVVAILRSMGVEEFEPRVLHQLLEFMHSYCIQVFQDGADFAEHSGRAGQIECEDVMLAVRLKEAASNTYAPQLIEWLARTRNKEKLPDPNPPLNAMPPLNLCLMQKNYQLEPTERQLAVCDGDQMMGSDDSQKVTSKPQPPQQRAAPTHKFQIKLQTGDDSGMADADAEADDVWE